MIPTALVGMIVALVSTYGPIGYVIAMIMWNSGARF